MMSVNLQDGSGDSGADNGGSTAKAFSRHHTSWSMHVSMTTELLEIPSTKNHTATLVGNEVYVFGGYDGQKNHNELFVFELLSMEWRQPHVTGNKPSGRNGHSATLLHGGDQILILGGWLGNGPLAAGDMHLLNLSPCPKWATPSFAGEPPGPCNMHTVREINKIAAAQLAELQALQALEMERREKVAVEQKEQKEKDAAAKAVTDAAHAELQEQAIAAAKTKRAASRAKQEEFRMLIEEDSEVLRNAANALMEAEYGSKVQNLSAVPLRLFTRRKEVAWTWAGDNMELIGGGINSDDDSWDA